MPEIISHEEYVIDQQIRYLDEQITFQHHNQIHTFTRSVLPLGLEKAIVNRYNNTKDVHLEIGKVDGLFNVYCYIEAELGPVTFYLIKDKEGVLPPTQWVLTGFDKYTEIYYPSIYLGANLFQHADGIFTVSDNELHRLDGIFYSNRRDDNYNEDALVHDYVYRLTGRHPNYNHYIEETYGGSKYLNIQIQLSLPAEDNPWGKQTSFLNSLICIQKCKDDWLYQVSTMNLPGSRYQLYDDTCKDIPSEDE